MRPPPPGSASGIYKKLTKRMYFLAYLVGGFHSHLHISSFNINTNIPMKGASARQSQVCVKGKGHLFLQNKCFKQKNVVFLTFVTIYLIWNPKPDKDNTCTTIHYHEGDTPLRYMCCPISALRTAYCHVLASSTAYRLKTKQPF